MRTFAKNIINYNHQYEYIMLLKIKQITISFFAILICNSVLSQKVDTIIFDKTGTITQGKPSVTDIITNNIDEDYLLQIAASAEKGSEHPLGEAIVKFAQDKNLELIKLDKYKSNTVQNHQNLFLLKEIKNKINYMSEQKKSLKLNTVTYINVKEEDINKIIELKSIEMKHREIDYSSVEIKTQQIVFKSSIEFYRDLKKYIKICPYCGNPIH